MLPEKQKKQVLTAETLRPLIDAFLKFESENETQFVANKRAFSIAYLLASNGEEKGFDMIENDYSAMLYKNLKCKKEAMMLIMRLAQL